MGGRRRQVPPAWSRPPLIVDAGGGGFTLPRQFLSVHDGLQRPGQCPGRLHRPLRPPTHTARKLSLSPSGVASAGAGGGGGGGRAPPTSGKPGGARAGGGGGGGSSPSYFGKSRGARSAPPPPPPFLEQTMKDEEPKVEKARVLTSPLQLHPQLHQLGGALQVPCTCIVRCIGRGRSLKACATVCVVECVVLHTSSSTA
jgi:hypothetical protein